MSENKSTSPDSVYFCTDVMGDKHGPITEQEIQALSEYGLITHTTTVWEAKEIEQKTAEQLSVLKFPYTEQQVAARKFGRYVEHFFFLSRGAGPLNFIYLFALSVIIHRAGRSFGWW